MNKDSTSIAARTEKNFFIFFLWTSLIPIVLLFVAGYYVTANLLEKQAFEKQAALAEQKHAELQIFAKKIEDSTAAWGTDGRIRELTEKITPKTCPSISAKNICPTALELSQYLADEKVRLNTSIEIIDILNIDGIVIASNDVNRVGIDEGKEQSAFLAASLFPFGQARVLPELVSEEDEFGGLPMIDIVTPIAPTSNDKTLSGILLAHIENSELNSVVSENIGQTTESYLVNARGIMITPSRFIADTVLKQRINTEPVRECIEHNMSFSGPFTDYRGVEVFGASACDQELFGTLIVKTDKAEIFIEINRIRNIASLVLAIVLILILGYAYFSGADLVRGVRHILPNTIPSVTTLAIIISVIVLSTVGISVVFSENIQKFILSQKIDIASTLVSQQAIRHINGSTVSAFDTWQSLESQQKFKDFNDEVLRSFRSAAAVQLYTTSGVLVWSSLQNAKIGTSPESDNVINALRTGETTAGAQASTISEVGTSSLVGVYIPIRNTNNDITGVAETYINTSDIVLFTTEIQRVLWIGSLVATAIIFLLLRYSFRKQDLKILSQSAKLRGLIDHSPIGIYTVRNDGKIETFNPSIERMFNRLGIKDIANQNIFELDYTQSTGLSNLIRGGLAGSAFKKEIEVQSQADGIVTYHDYYGVPIKNIDGNTEYLLLMADDITERKKLEQKIHEYATSLEQKVEERTRDIENDRIEDEAILTSIGEGVIATNKDNIITVVNTAAERMLGWSRAELMGKIKTDIIPAQDEAGSPLPPEKRIGSIVSTGGSTKPLTTNMAYVKKDGSVLPVAVTATPIILNNKSLGAVVIFRDITKEREIEQTRRDLLSLASHQLRTPLSGMNWLIETLKKGIHGTLSKKQVEYIDEIYRINQKMTTLVHEMLGVLRMEGDTAVIKKESVSILSIINPLLETLSPAAAAKKLTLQLINTRDYTISTNQTLLQNIVESIVSNAINYSPNNSKVAIQIDQAPGEIVIIVRDNGIGIPKSEQARLFERFYRASNAKIFDTSGTGLGLYTASMLAKKLGASITFTSEENKGSTFSIHIPYTPQ